MIVDPTLTSSQWKISAQGSLWTIQSVYNNGYLDSDSPGSSKSGTKLVVYTAKIPVKWHLIYDDKGQGWR